MERADQLWAWRWGAARWVDEVLTQLSPVEGQSMPGVSTGLQGEDISAQPRPKVQQELLRRVETAPQAAGQGHRGLCVGNPQFCAATSGGPESDEGQVEWQGILPTPQGLLGHKPDHPISVATLLGL